MTCSAFLLFRPAKQWPQRGLQGIDIVERPIEAELGCKPFREKIVLTGPGLEKIEEFRIDSDQGQIRLTRNAKNSILKWF